MQSFGSNGQQWLLFSTILLLLLPLGVWNGFACLSNPCIHGVCLDDLNSTYFCYCIDGYTGIQCQTNWNECWSSPCQNGGICIDGIAMFNCSCPPGYLGDLCEQDINECESNPCLNNGTCLDASNGYNCNCLVGYSGTHCEIDVAVCNTTNETRCFNGGFCEEGPGDSFTCRCQPGWGGFLCDSEIDECRPAPCQNGAVCIDMHADYACACLFGFSGKNCEESVQICDENPCKNGALCLIEENQNTCYCVPDFHGELCEFQYDECQLGPRCMNGGTCIDGIDNFTCSCPQNLTGVLCECLILGEDKFDCTYVSPKTTTIITTTIEQFENTTTSSIFTTFETTLVPNISTVISTDLTLDTTITPFSTELPLETFSTTFSTDNVFTSQMSSTTSLFSETTYSETFPTKVTLPMTFSTTAESSTELLTSTELITTLTPETKTETEFPIFSTSSEMTTTYPNITSIGSTKEFTDETSTANTEPSRTTDGTTIFTPTTTESIYITTIPTTSPEGREVNETVSPSEETTVYATTTNFFTDKPTEFTQKSTTGFTTPPPSESTVSTTFIPSTEGTTLPPSTTDCSLSENRCNNGGTCILTDYGHKCICPFDTEGALCEVRLGVTRAAFSGDSYLSHRLTNFSHILFEFEAKTLATSGLLFHSNIETTYMALYIEDGYLKFKFSCGYQTMLLSELKVPVNTGYPMNIRAELGYSKDLKHCDAEVKLNKTLTMMGDQTAKVDKFLNPTAWLHLGGIPQDLLHENLPSEGFVGCISELKISGEKVNIFKDAEDGFQVSECSSLACLANPCGNGASCIAKGEEQWECKCKNGYLGKTCENSICENNPCLYGGTCIPFSGSGYLCLCPYGKHGHFCENDLKISDPYFSSSVRGLSSFVAYPIPSGISRNMEIEFRFTPTSMEQISLMLFIGQHGQHDFYSDHIAVSFVKGYIMLTWNLGSGPRRIFTTQPIKSEARDYLVRLGHFGRRAWLFVENLGNVTGRSPGNLVQLDVVPRLYLGGHYTKNFSTLPHDLPLHTGFTGCIFDVKMKSGSVVIPFQGSRQTIGRAVGQCGTTECYEQSCQNDGACLHHGSTFMCLCQDSWYGPLCTLKNNPCDATSTKCGKESTCVPLLSSYECDCPLGKTGQYCKKNENISDVSLTGQRSYISLYPIEVDNARFNIEMELRILNDHGVVMFIGKRGLGYVCLSLQNGILELKVQASKSKIITNTPLTIRSTKLLVKGLWHKIQLGVFGRKVYLSVDNVINTGLLDMGNTVSISKENIFLGGLPDLSLLASSATSNLPIPYTGCIRHLSVDTKQIPLTSENIQKSRNVIDCDGTPCGGESCQNGGTCWLDSFMKPHCSCIQPYYGEKCEKVPSCNENGCKNNGQCQNSKCSCKLGWHGVFCEKEIVVRTPEFSGKSYLIVGKIGDKKRNIKETEIRGIYLNFTTAKPNGLLVWSKKERNFVGIGIERGNLKVVYSLGKSKEFVEVPSYVQVSDGLWHNMAITFGPLSFKLDNKTLQIFNKKQDKFVDNSIISTNGVFYIGGIPTNSSLLKETNGMFGNGFEGCIEGFGSNSEVIRNFSRFEGSNVDVCDIF